MSKRNNSKREPRGFIDRQYPQCPQCPQYPQCICCYHGKDCSLSNGSLNVINSINKLKEEIRKLNKKVEILIYNQMK